MHKYDQALSTILEQKLLPLFYHDSPETSIRITKALFDGGVKVIEYTNRGESALENFRELRKAVDKTMPGMLLGIGTVKAKKSAKKYVEAGADFIVAPSINEEVGKVAREAGLLWIPGCMTPTEIAAAENAGAELVKIFPGSLLGPSYITAIRDLFPGLKFVVTGGVEADANNLKAWFASGVRGVGMGSKLITKEALSSGNYEALTRMTAEALQLVQNASQHG